MNLWHSILDIKLTWKVQQLLTTRINQWWAMHIFKLKMSLGYLYMFDII